MELMERRRILLNTPHINIVTGLQFVTDMVAPLESLVINFSPIQDLHGYDNPWPAGGGKNLFNPLLVGDYIKYVINDDGTITVTGTDGRAWTNLPVIPLSAGTYTIKVYGHKRSQMRTSEDDYMSDIYLQSSAYTFTLSADGGIKLKLGLGDTYPITVYVQVESGSSATDWTPYSNVCPITGWTGANVVACSVNVWDEEWELGSYSNTNGEPTTHTDRIRSKNRFGVLPNTEYFFKTSNGLTAGNAYFYDVNDVFISARTTIGNTAIVTPNNCKYMRIAMGLPYGATYNNDVSINCPSTDHDYHPYVGTSVNINWTNEAGEVYGGTLNVITGELIVDRVGFDGGDINWVKVDDYNYGNFCSPNLNPLPKYSATVPTVLSSIYRSAATSSGTSGDAYAWIRSVNTGMRRIYIRDTSKANMTAEEIKTSLIGVDFVYVLDAPIIYQLTPQQIRTVKGTNNLFSNSNGEVTVNYWTHLD